MEYTEKITWQGRSLVLKRSEPPTKVLDSQSGEVKLCHRGGMIWETELGTVTLRPGEMFLIPQGVAHRAVPPEGGGENVLIELKIRPPVRKVFPDGARGGAA
ncbi:MAG: hypothetical protein HY725_04040 [Candidatus Rokubacteria bacterium]|nr:hypothetical protein [Candidatus Rokubacteria bacterium]